MHAWFTLFLSGRNNVAPLLPEGVECIVPASSFVRMTLPRPGEATIEVSSYAPVEWVLPPRVLMKFAGLMRPVGRLLNVARSSVLAEPPDFTRRILFALDHRLLPPPRTARTCTK